MKITQTTWNLNPLLKSDDDPEIDKKLKLVEQKSHEFIDKWKNRDDFLKDPKILKQALDEYEAWLRDYGTSGNPGYYFSLRTYQDQNNPILKAKYNKIEDFSTKIQNEIQFFTLKISKIPQAEQIKFLSFEGLNPYKHFLERLFLKSKHLLSESEEKIMNLKSSTSYENWVKMISGFLSKEEKELVLEDGKKAIKNYSEINSLMNSKNKKVRDNAAAVFNDILRKYQDTAEAEINSILANKKTDDEIRNLFRPDRWRHIADDIDTEAVDTLADAVSSRFDISKQYYEFKAKLMGVKKLEYHERSVEYGNIDKKDTYEEAINLIHRVFKNLDKEFANILEKFADGRIDAFPQKGKRAGACCIHNLISQPVYLLLNHTDQLKDVLTIAHELGHGINYEIMKKKQNVLNFGTILSTAEVASTFMEDFVFQELMKQADDDLKLVLMMSKLNQDVSTIFRQIACYKFEQELHHEFRQKGYLSKDEIGKLFQKHMEAYMGHFVEQSSGSENWWISWPHIRDFFYNYSYASGLLISKSLQNSVKKDHKFIEKVKEFLSTGLADSPKNIFMKFGIDIADKNFWNKGIEEVEALLKETEALAKKLGKI